MRLHVLELGRCDVDVGAVLTPGVDDGVHKLIPIPSYLLELDSGERIVIDTGMHPAHIEDPDHTFRGKPLAEILRPVMGPEDLLEHRLGQLGLGLGDVKFLAAAGIWVGLAGIPFVLLIATMTALACAGVMQLSGRALTARTSLSFGPFLAAGLLVTVAFQQYGI